MIRTILVGLALVAAVSLTLMASPLNAQTPILVQHKLSGDSVCSGMSTCTVTLNSPTVAGHALLLGIAGAGFGGFPVASSPVGDSAWTHCPNAIGQYESDSTDWIFTDCYYILSAAGGATSISVTLTGQTAAQIENMDVDVMEVTCTTACLASYDASNNVVDSGNCSTCASETLALTGSNDAILQIGNFVEQFVSVASPYSVLDSDSVSANAFAYWLNGNSGASVNWRQNSAQQAVFAGLALKFSSPPPGTTFYISSGIGSDSNNGTTKTTPWAHLPGMVNCSSNCAAYSPGAGDQFILRGGDAWASSSLGINWQWSGTSSFPIYIGVDQTWYGGNSWTRPVWSCGGASCSGTGPQANFFNTGSSYVTVDNIEVTGLYSSAPSLANYFNVYGANDIFEHIYAHGWSHAAASTGTPDSSSVFNFNPAYATTGDAVHDSVIDGTDTTQDSMGCFTGALPAAYNNVCEYVTNGFEGAGSNIHDNWFGPIVTSFVSGQNQNALLQFGPDNSATSAFIYNNVIANSTCAACGGVVKLGLSANNANTATGYAFNNVLFNNAQGNYLSLGGHSAVNYGTWNFFNNTLECGTDAATGPCGSDANGASGMSFVFHSQNNHYVTSASPANSCSFSTCSSTTDLTQPVSAANTQGYTSTSTYALQPTSGLGATISAGTNSQSLCTTIAGLNSAAGTACLADTSYACNYVTGNHTVNCPDRNENARPASSAWDVGAYQAIVAPAIITQPSNQTVSSGQTATFTVVAGGTAPLTYQWLENNATIMGATSASYTTPPTTTANTGEQFTVVVTNGVSSVTSSPAATLVVSTPTTLTMTAAPTSSTYGQSVTLTATLSPVTAGSFTNAGETIVFQDFGTTVGTGTINSSGVATITLTKMPAITNNLVAYYLGDSDFLPSNSATLHFPVNPAVLTVTAQSVSRPFGAANPAFTATYSGFVNGDSQTSATTGAPSLTTTATSTSPAGTYPITASTGTLAAPNYTFSFVAGTLTVTQATPAITWTTPAAITFGATLSGAQLDATTSVPGTFVYTPAAGSTPATGMNTLSVTFTPADAIDYAGATGSVILTVNKATPVITWAAPAAISFGTALGSAQLDATASVGGAFVYSPAAGIIPSTGSDSLSVTFTPGDKIDYTIATGSVMLTVNQASTATTLTSSANPALPATNVIFSATVISDAGTPGGSVNFMDGNTLLGTTTLNGSGVASFSTSSLAPGQHSITGVYSTSGNYLGSASPVLTQVVQQAVIVGLASNGSPSQPGSSVTFTATVTGGSAIPTGSVTFKDAGTVLGTGTLNGAGAATFSSSGLSLGSHSITAIYGGDADSMAGASGALAQLVQQVTSTTLSSNGAFLLAGANVTFTATVAGGSATPTGTVTFAEGGTTLGAGTLNGTGTATFSTTSLSMGAHSITANYGGDANSQSSVSLVYTQTLQETTNTVVASNNNPSTTGTPVTFAASVTTSGTGSPTGTVTFLDGTTVLGSATLDASFHATFLTTSLPNGPQSITAVYSGDITNMSSTSAAIIQNVQAITTAPLISSNNPSVGGQPVTFTATVLATGSFTPTGMVTFNDGGTALGAMPLSSVAGVATAAFSISSLLAGTHSITAVYSGDSNNAPSTSAPLSQVVKAGTTITVATSGSPSLLGNSVTLSASVPSGAAGQPTGTVSFRDNGTEIGTGTLDGSGNTSISTSTLAVGSHAIVAMYFGDALNAGSSSNTVTQNVREQTQTTVLSSLNPSQPGASVTFTATLTASGPGTITGTVTFNDGGTQLGTGALSTSGAVTSATLATSALSLGGHPITAVYSGDALNAPCTSSALTQDVAQTTTIAISSSINPANFGNSVTLTAAVTPANSGTPTGTVSFMEASTPLGTGTLNASGTASITLSNLAPAQHSITAVYGGDVDSGASTSTIFIQTIRQTTATALAVNVNPSVSGNSITLTATVTPAVSGTPTGSVAFMEGTMTLGSGTLNASGVASLAIAALSVGSHSIVAVYAGDAVDLSSSSSVLSQTVEENTSMTLTASSNPAPAGTFITLTATVAPGSSGTPTGSVTFLDGSKTLGTGTLNVSGIATFATQSLGAGSHSIMANYGGDADNLPSTATLMLTVNKAVPAIAWATPVAINFGATLGGTQLDATSSVAGTFVYNPAAGNTPGAGNDTLSVTFTPTDTTDYTTATASVMLTVNRATPALTWATPAAITSGTALSTTQLDATSSVAGTFVYNPAAGAIPAIGSDTLSVTFTPTDSIDYNTAATTVMLTVNNKITPTISWATPATITFSTPLSGTQLDATASVGGTFVYSPTAGTIPAAGTDTLLVTFTPNDTADFNAATATVNLQVADFTLSDTNSSSQTVATGGSATFSFSVTPVGSSTLLIPVTLSATGLPPGATSTFTPMVIPAGSPATGVNLVIQLGNSSAVWDPMLHDHASYGSAPFALGLLLLPLLAMQRLRKRGQLRLRWAGALLLAGLSLGAMAGLSGCAGGSGTAASAPATTPASTSYNVVVTETAGTLQHAFNLTLVVQK